MAFHKSQYKVNHAGNISVDCCQFVGIVGLSIGSRDTSAVTDCYVPSATGTAASNWPRGSIEEGRRSVSCIR